MPFGRALERVDDAAAHQTKIAGIDWDRNFGKALDDAVEQARSKELKWTFAFARSPHRVDDVVAFAPLCIERGDELGRVLQIAVHQDDRVARSDIDAGRGSELVTEIAREINQHDMLASCELVADARERAVGAAVVYQDDLVRGRAFQTPDDCNDALDERDDVALFVVQRYDNAERRHDRSASTRARRTFGMQRLWAIVTAAFVLNLTACAQRAPAPHASVAVAQTPAPLQSATPTPTLAPTPLAAPQTAAPTQSAATPSPGLAPTAAPSQHPAQRR